MARDWTLASVIVPVVWLCFGCTGAAEPPPGDGEQEPTVSESSSELGSHRCDRGPCPGPAPSLIFCGGIAGFPCPSGFECVDDPRDDCDPCSGGADCGGICVVLSCEM